MFLANWFKLLLCFNCIADTCLCFGCLMSMKPYRTPVALIAKRGVDLCHYSPVHSHKSFSGFLIIKKFCVCLKDLKVHLPLCIIKREQMCSAQFSGCGGRVLQDSEEGPVFPKCSAQQWFSNFSCAQNIYTFLKITDCPQNLFFIKILEICILEI